MTATAAPSDDLGPAALAYVRTGLRVFPIRRDKHPLSDHGKLDATTDAETIAAWWRRWPTANVAALTGRVAGFVVLDVDPRNGGDLALDELQTRHEPLPATLTCRTGGGGRHFYFAHPGGEVRTTHSAMGPGLDVLGERACVILPPSVHASGGRYAWLDSSVQYAPLPRWLRKLVQPAPRPRAEAPPVRASAGSRYVQGALESEIATLRSANEGKRNDTLNLAAFNLGTLVGAGVLPENVAVAALLAAALATQLDEREARGTIASGLRAGRAQPRRVGRR